MKLEKLIGERFRERPADCVIDSHALMVKGGYMKYMANGIYSSYLPLKRITHKIEQILREEMDKLDGQEVSFPVVMPASLWEESGRYESVGEELSFSVQHRLSCAFLLLTYRMFIVPFPISARRLVPLKFPRWFTIAGYPCG